MASNRILKDWTESDKVNNLSVNAEVFFVRLIMKADDHGVFHANPKLLKANLFPLKDAIRDTDIIRWVAECAKAELILTYKANDREYLQIINFGQRLRSMRSKYPLPNDGDMLTNDSNKPPEEKRREEEVEYEEEVEGESGILPQIQTQEQIDFLKFCEWIKEKAPQVAKLSNPFTLDEFLKIKKEFPSEAVKNILLQMQNKKDLLKRYTSAYLTALNWLKRAKEEQASKTVTKVGKLDSVLESAQEQLIKRGLI